jgi:hypothetical protein
VIAHDHIVGYIATNVNQYRMTGASKTCQANLGNQCAHRIPMTTQVGLWWVFNASGRDFPSSRPSVVMVQPTENWNTNDGAIGLWLV